MSTIKLFNTLNANRKGHSPLVIEVRYFSDKLNCYFDLHIIILNSHYSVDVNDLQPFQKKLKASIYLLIVNILM